MIGVRRALALVISVAVVSGGLSVATPAQAYEATVSKKMSLTNGWWSNALKAYIQVKLTGTAEARYWTVVTGRSPSRNLGRFTIKDPKIVVTSYTSSSMKKRKVLSGAVFTDLYYDPQCGVQMSGVSLSGSLGGFSLGVSMTYRCSNELVMRRTGDFRKSKNSRWSMSATGANLVWKRSVGMMIFNHGVLTLCNQPQIRVSVYKGAKGDAHSFSPGQVCLSVSH